MQYDIKELRRREDDLALFVRQHFNNFFKKYDYTADSKDVVSYTIKTLADIERTYYGTGFYLILTDYMRKHKRVRSTEHRKCSILLMR